MEPGYALGLEVWTIWKCKKCGHRQDAIENEEWPYHCGDTMSIGAMRKFVVNTDQSTLTREETP